MGDVGGASVHNDDGNSDLLEKDDVFCPFSEEFWVLHGGASEFDDDTRGVIFFDMRKDFGKKIGSMKPFLSFFAVEEDFFGGGGGGGMMGFWIFVHGVSLVGSLAMGMCGL